MSYSHLTMRNRICIEILIRFKLTQEEIANYIGVHQSTISRELNRNKGKDKYCPMNANKKYKEKRKKSKPKLKIKNIDLMKFIIDKLKIKWSPEAISGKLPLIYPNNSSMRISYNTIYNIIYDDKKNNGELYKYLTINNKKYKRRSKSWMKRKKREKRIFIDQRPEIVEKKVRIGDWEGDTIVSTGRKSFLSTFVERKTGYLISKKIDNLKSDTFNKSAIQGFKNIPEKYRKTLTLDNGVEMSKPEDISVSLGFDIYFAHPYSPWERGLNEYTNRLIRQYYPKNYDFINLTQKELDKTVDLINNRPRKKLGYLSPYEVFIQNKVCT